MRTRLGASFQWLPDQMAFFNAVLVIVMVPLFSEFVYPAVAKCGLVVTSTPSHSRLPSCPSSIRFCH